VRESAVAPPACRYRPRPLARDSMALTSMRHAPTRSDCAWAPVGQRLARSSISSGAPYRYCTTQGVSARGIGKPVWACGQKVIFPFGRGQGRPWEHQLSQLAWDGCIKEGLIWSGIHQASSVRIQCSLLWRCVRLGHPTRATSRPVRKDASIHYLHPYCWLLPG